MTVTLWCNVEKYMSDTTAGLLSSEPTGCGTAMGDVLGNGNPIAINISLIIC